MQYIKKKLFSFLITAFVFYCDVKHLDILWGSSHVCFYLFLVYSKMGAVFYTMTLKTQIYIGFIEVSIESWPERFIEVSIESWPEWDLIPRPLNSVQTL